MPALEQLQQDLHLVGVLLEAAQQRVVPHHRLQHVGVRVVAEHVLLAQGGGGQTLVQHLLAQEKPLEGKNFEHGRLSGQHARHLLHEDHDALLQADEFVRHPLGLVEQHFRGVVIKAQRGLQVDERFDPRLDQHQHRVQQPLVLQEATEHHGGGATSSVTAASC